MNHRSSNNVSPSDSSTGGRGTAKRFFLKAKCKTYLYMKRSYKPIAAMNNNRKVLNKILASYVSSTFKGVVT